MYTFTIISLTAHVDGIIAGRSNVGDGACSLGGVKDLVVDESVFFDGTIHVSSRNMATNL